MSQNEQRRWFVVYSKAQKEGVAEFQLRLKGLDVFFPRLLLPRFSRKRKRIVPLFPNYLFVRINLATEYYDVLWSPGVRCFVSFNDIPMPLDDGVLESFMRLANSEQVIRARPDLKVGQEVRIAGGAFDGLVGMLQNAPDAKGRVKLLMKLLSREIEVEAPVHLVASGWVASEPDLAGESLEGNKIESLRLD